MLRMNTISNTFLPKAVKSIRGYIFISVYLLYYQYIGYFQCLLNKSRIMSRSKFSIIFEQNILEK